MSTIRVYLEAGSRKTFASALDWPGWSRSGTDEAAALEALLASAPRYARVAAAAEVRFPAAGHISDLAVVERVRGGSTTDFGAPGEPASGDDAPVDAEELERLRRLLVAAWGAFDAAADAAAGVQLRVGPRGGGRTIEKMRAHLLGADAGYVTKLGARSPKGAADAADAAAGLAAVRAVAVEALLARGRDEPVPNASGTRSRWPLRYYVRRSAWHALDHAWEIEDRAAPGRSGEGRR